MDKITNELKDKLQHLKETIQSLQLLKNKRKRIEISICIEDIIDNVEQFVKKHKNITNIKFITLLNKYNSVKTQFYKDKNRIYELESYTPRRSTNNFENITFKETPFEYQLSDLEIQQLKDNIQQTKILFELTSQVSNVQSEKIEEINYNIDTSNESFKSSNVFLVETVQKKRDNFKTNCGIFGIVSCCLLR